MPCHSAWAASPLKSGMARSWDLSHCACPSLSFAQSPSDQGSPCSCHTCQFGLKILTSEALSAWGSLLLRPVWLSFTRRRLAQPHSPTLSSSPWCPGSLSNSSASRHYLRRAVSSHFAIGSYWLWLQQDQSSWSSLPLCSTLVCRSELRLCLNPYLWTT